MNSLRDNNGRKYDIIFNSTGNSRGVAILVSNMITDFQIAKEYKDVHENYYLLDCTINASKFCLGAIYGPNNTSRAFFADLTRIIAEIRARGTDKIIVGGDWNTTWDRRPITENIDTFHMAGLPNAKNSELLENMCSSLNLIDPYRALYPDKRDFTYSPFGNVRLNRSRLDFFIVSVELLESVLDCTIANSPRCKLFDHKNVNLELGSERPKCTKKNTISNSFLDVKALDFSVNLAARRAHLFSIDRTSVPCPLGYASMEDVFSREKGKVDGCLILLRELVSKLENKAINNPSELLDLEIAGLEQQICADIDDMLPLNILENI
jgi:exonuclease III